MSKKQMRPRSGSRSKPLPATYLRFAARFPGLVNAHRDMTAAAERSGPLDRKTCELIRIGIALGAGHETSFRSHVRRALEQGAQREEVEQAIVLAATTCGFSRAVAGWKWAQDLF